MVLLCSIGFRLTCLGSSFIRINVLFCYVRVDYLYGFRIIYLCIILHEMERETT